MRKIDYTITPWRQPMAYDFQMADVLVRFIATTKSGQRFPIQLVSRAIITFREKKEHSDFEALKAIKLTMAQMDMETKVSELLSKRGGIVGHRGFFKIVKLEPYVEKFCVHNMLWRL